MSSKWLKSIASGLVLSAILASGGCMHWGPHMGISVVPIPVSPYFQDKEEDEFWEHERYERVPILGPITAGGPVAGARSAERRRDHSRAGTEPSGRGRLPVLARSATQ